MEYGGPNGELGASLRYLSQRYVMPYPELKAILTDVGTEVPKCSFRPPERGTRQPADQKKARKAFPNVLPGFSFIIVF